MFIVDTAARDNSRDRDMRSDIKWTSLQCLNFPSLSLFLCFIILQIVKRDISARSFLFKNIKKEIF